MYDMSREIWLNISSGNGLLPKGTKPLPVPVSTHHQRCSVGFIWEKVHKEYSIPSMSSEVALLKLLCMFPISQGPISKYIYIINNFWDGPSNWNFSFWRQEVFILCLGENMVSDILVMRMQGARASAEMLLHVLVLEDYFPAFTQLRI